MHWMQNYASGRGVVMHGGSVNERLPAKDPGRYSRLHPCSECAGGLRADVTRLEAVSRPGASASTARERADRRVFVVGDEAFRAEGNLHLAGGELTRPPESDSHVGVHQVRRFREVRLHFVRKPRQQFAGGG